MTLTDAVGNVNELEGRQVYWCRRVERRGDRCFCARVDVVGRRGSAFSGETLSSLVT